MTKLDVGIGEEFPLDEDAPRQPENKAESVGCDEDWRNRRRQRREAWRRFRDQMHAEWHGRRRGFRDGLNRQDDAEILDALRSRHVQHLALGALALIGLAALLGLRRND